MNPVLRVLLLGTRSPDNVWYLINIDVLKKIWFMVVDCYEEHFNYNTTPFLNVAVLQRNNWPKPNDISINMMPFIIGEENSIPKKYRQYWPLIRKCPIESEEYGKVGYLTIHESLVQPGQSQRRPGIHTETPGLLIRGGEVITTEISYGWGGGEYHENHCYGGIYMASTISDSCAVWEVKIDKPAEIVGPGGDIDHLRSLLGNYSLMKENEIWWITDATPHESLPLKRPQYRQFFRVVTSAVSVWYKDHSTENELGIKPNERTLIISENKFNLKWIRFKKKKNNKTKEKNKPNKEKSKKKEKIEKKE